MKIHDTKLLNIILTPNNPYWGIHFAGMPTIYSTCYFYSHLADLLLMLVVKAR